MEGGLRVGARVNEACIFLYRILKLNFLFIICNPWLVFNVFFIPFTQSTYLFFLLSVVLSFPAMKAILKNAENKELTLRSFFADYRRFFFRSALTGVFNTLIFGLLLFNIANSSFVYRLFYPLVHGHLFFFPAVFTGFLFVAIFASLVQLKIEVKATAGKKLLYSYFYMLRHPSMLLYALVFALVLFMEITSLPASILVTLAVGADLWIVSKVLDITIKNKEHKYGTNNQQKKAKKI